MGYTLHQVVLTKNGKTATLQGMCHAAPLEFYKTVQSDIDDAVKRGDQIFCEGISINGLISAESFNERLIHSFWERFFESMETEAKLKGWVLERDSLNYPPSAITADMHVNEIVALLNKRGFACKLPVALFRLTKPAFHLKVIDAIERGLLMANGKKAVPQNIEETVLTGLFQKYGRKLYPVIIVHRNRLVMNAIKQHYAGGNIFVTYGNSHISGLTDLFLFDKWIIESISEIDPENSTKPIRLSIFEHPNRKERFLVF